MWAWWRKAVRWPLLLVALVASLAVGPALVAQAAASDRPPWWCDRFPWLPTCNWPAPWLSVGTRSGALVTFTAVETEETEKGELLVRAHVQVQNAGKQDLDPTAIRFRLAQQGTDNALRPDEVKFETQPAASPGQGRTDTGRPAPAPLRPGEEVKGTVTFRIPQELLKERTQWQFAADGQQAAALVIDFRCTITPTSIRCTIIVRFD